MMARFHIAAAISLLLLSTGKSSTEGPAHKTLLRRNHARELLGKGYSKSIVREVGEIVSDIEDFVRECTENSLRKSWKHLTRDIASTLVQESERYGFDPILLMAVIESESKFNPVVIGSQGEIGLMQLTSDTAKWITQKYRIPWEGAESLKDPVVNIRIGAAYLAHLREEFKSRSQLYLAAYNMGSGNVRRSLEKQILPKIYHAKVMEKYLEYYSRLSTETGTAVVTPL